VVDHGFESGSDPTKECKIGISWALRRKYKDWLTRNQDNTTKGDTFVHNASEIWMALALNTITLTLFTFIFMVQYFAVYCSLQTSPMQVMCCSDRVLYFAFCLFCSKWQRIDSLKLNKVDYLKAIVRGSSVSIVFNHKRNILTTCIQDEVL
jgi:hypothetical protein